MLHRHKVADKAVTPPDPVAEALAVMQLADARCHQLAAQLHQMDFSYAAADVARRESPHYAAELAAGRAELEQARAVAATAHLAYYATAAAAVPPSDPPTGERQIAAQEQARLVRLQGQLRALGVETK